MHSIVLTNDWVSDMSGGKYDNKPILEAGNKMLINYTDITMRTAFRYELLYRPATALYLSIILMIAVCVKEKKISYILTVLPMLLNIGTYVFLISSQDQRYFYPNFMTLYLWILIAGEVFLKNKKIVPKKRENEKKKGNKTLVIVPAYNESKSINNVVNSILKQNIENCDVLVVNDGSKDNTYEEAKKTKAIVINSPNNLGIGGAVQTGYLYAYKNNYDIAIQIDGDGQHDPKYILDLIHEIENGNDLVIGSRFVEKTNYNQKFFRMLGNNIISFIIKASTKVKIYDTTSGYRAVNRDLIKEFVEFYPYDYPEPCTNMSMIKKGYKVKEVRVEMKQRQTGESFVSPLKAASYMFKVTLSILIMGIKE